MRTYPEAEASIRKQSKSGPPFRVGLCLQRCRLVYGIPARDQSASEAWSRAKYRHTEGGHSPAGAFEFWTGGSKGYGHIAISAGGGWCWSTDIERRGYFDLVPTSVISQKWRNQKYVGWTEDINGKRVNVAPVTKWAKVRRDLEALLASEDMKAVIQKRRSVRLFVRATRAWLANLPKD